VHRVTPLGSFLQFSIESDGFSYTCLVRGEVRGMPALPLWLHCECHAVDHLRASLCPCGILLTENLQRLGQAQCGVLVFRHLGRRSGADEVGPTSSERLRVVDEELQRVADRSVLIKLQEHLEVKNFERVDSTLECAHRKGDRLAPATVPKSRPELLSRSQAARQCVTLTYAQSIDGSIATRSRQPLALSSADSLTLTHALRATHDAIVVGVNTVIADNPLLTVRHVEGEDPQPVVLDRRLRMPLDARLLANRRKPWIFCTFEHSPDVRKELEAKGARVFVLPSVANGLIDVHLLLVTLREHGLHRILVEGGATVISTFLVNQCVDEVVITIAPKILGGMPATTAALTEQLQISELKMEQWGPDLVLRGRPSIPARNELEER
jgi:riboflavin-specific deaminase-like protein